MKSPFFGLSLFVSLLMLGCGGGETKVVVNGSVTIDGQPLTTGRVDFEPQDGKSRNASANIGLDGKYSADMPPGKKIIRVYANKVVGKEPAYENNPSGPQKEIVKPWVATKYGSESQDVRDITASQTIDLKVESAK